MWLSPSGQGTRQVHDAADLCLIPLPARLWEGLVPSSIMVCGGFNT